MRRILPAFAILILGLLLGAAGTWWWLSHRDEPLRSVMPLRFPELATPDAAEPLPELGDDEGEARSLVILLGDGLGLSHLAAARALLLGPNGRLVLDRFPVASYSYSHSVRQLYTDSAAGATALATGRKTYPGGVSVDTDGQPMRTLAELARDAGKAVGVLTDSYFYDASPAAFLAHRESRRETLGVIEDMAAAGVDLVLGEVPSDLEEHEDWAQTVAMIESRGVAVARDVDALRAAASPVFGLFSEGRIADPDHAPSLRQLASLALDRLVAAPSGFVLFVETEETDTASHRGDLERAVRGVGQLDSVAGLLVERADELRGTLVVATSDHETGGLVLLDGRDGEPLEYRWATRGHSAAPVPLLAWGAGAARFGAAHDNAEVGRLLRQALDLP